MNNRVSSIANIRTVKALRGEILRIDLGKVFTGTLTAWMKKDPNSTTYRSFVVENNRYLILTQDKARDYYDTNNVLVEAIQGKWYFDVERLEDGSPIEETKTIYSGTIYFANDITGSAGYEITNPSTHSPQYTLSDISVDNIFSLLKNGQVISSIDLSPYVTEPQSRIVSGSLDPSTKRMTLVRDDNTTVQADLSALQSLLTEVTFGEIVNSLSEKPTIVGDDLFNITDSADSNKQKKFSFTNLKSSLKSYFDTLYASVAALVGKLDKVTTLGVERVYTISADGSQSTKATSDVVSQLEKITEDSNTGWRLLGKDPNNYGNIGFSAVDLSHSNSTSSTIGATGSYSHTQGFKTTASAPSSHAQGFLTIASGDRSHAQNYGNLASGSDSHAEGNSTIASGYCAHSQGSSTTASGRYTHAGGHLNKAQTYAETVVGFFAKEIAGNADAKQAIDPVFRVGIGNGVLDKFDGFGVYKNGAIYLYPSSLSTVTNTVKTGFLKLDENFVLNIHDGTQWKKVADPSAQQKTITTSRSALSSDNGCLIKIKGNATYTIDQSTLPTGWNVIVRTFTGATGTFVAANAGTTFDAPTGLILKPLKMCSIIKDSDDNKILINGETSLT